MNVLIISMYLNLIIQSKDLLIKLPKVNKINFRVIVKNLGLFQKTLWSRTTSHWIRCKIKYSQSNGPHLFETSPSGDFYEFEA